MMSRRQLAQVGRARRVERWGPGARLLSVSQAATG